MSLIAPQPSPEIPFHRLLQEARAGSSDARWLVVQLFRHVMLSIANEEIDDAIHAREAPSDIVQETIVEAQRDLDGFRGATEREMMAWLKIVLKRNILNLHLKYKTTKRDLNRERPIPPQTEPHEPGLADPGPSPSAIVCRQERHHALEIAISTLPEHYRRVIELRYGKGLGFKEIAPEINRSEAATRQLWCRALHELSRRLKVLLDE